MALLLLRNGHGRTTGWTALVVLGGLLLAVVGLILGFGSDAAPRVSPAPVSGRSVDTSVPGPVVLLGTGGLRWSDVTDQEPTLNRWLHQGSSGWLAVRSVRSATCPIDGWLAVSAGARSADVPSRTGEPVCRKAAVRAGSAGSAGTVIGWSRYVHQARDDSFDAEPGLLGDILVQHDVKSAAVGPGAAIALATSAGVAPHVWPGAVSKTSEPQALAQGVAAALRTDPEVLMVDLGSVLDAPPAPTGSPDPSGDRARSRRDQVREIETRLESVMVELPADATVIVASLADSGAERELRLLAATGPAVGGGTYTGSLLGSASTRQDGLAQTTDLFPTVLSALRLRVPDSAVGSPLEPVATGRSASQREHRLLDLDAAAIAVRPLLQLFFAVLVITQIVLYAAFACLLRLTKRRVVHHRALLSALHRCAVTFAGVPAATFLANLTPWWRAEHPVLVLTATVLLWAFLMALIALVGPWRRTLLGTVGAVGLMTSLVLAGDAVTGSHLMLSSLLGVQPANAGRFYGFSNPMFAVFVTAALLTAVAIADRLSGGHPRRLLGAVIAGIGLIAVIIDGLPAFGSDFGGPPAIIPGFAVLTLLALGHRITLRRALTILAITAAVITSLSVGDWTRGAGHRTHLGQFVQTAIDGDAFAVLKRKITMNVDTLFHSYLTATQPLVIIAIVLVLARPASWGAGGLQLAYDRSPVLRPGLIALSVTLLIGALMNDTGASIPADAATILLPLLIAVGARELTVAPSNPPPANTKQSHGGSLWARWAGLTRSMMDGCASMLDDCASVTDAEHSVPFQFRWLRLVGVEPLSRRRKSSTEGVKSVE